MNTFMNTLKDNTNFKYTEKGDITHKTSKSDVLDMFALGGSYRERGDNDVILLFKNAYEENPELALKCLFYLRDILEGQGERRFFRVAFKWLCEKHIESAKKNLINVSEYGRWDDLIYVAVNTPLQNEAFAIIKHQLALDVQCKTPSLLAKWLPSQNASNSETKRLGHILANYLKMTNKQYRKTLSILRERIKVVERLMSANRWEEIEFSKIPSKAGLIYKNAFARRDILAKKYETFAKDATTKVNAEALYPQEIAERIFNSCGYGSWSKRTILSETDRLMLQKYWDNLKDFYNGREENGIAIVDVSGSMIGTPMNAAVSLGAYIAEKAHGPFANHFITFSNRPQLVKFEGVDIVDKFIRCSNADWGGTTNLKAVFDLLLKTAKNQNTRVEDMPTRLYIFSDMEFDSCVFFGGENSWGYYKMTSENSIQTGLESIREKWAREGYKLPQVIFWNLNARNNNIPAIGEGFSYVSGFSPTLVETILSGRDGYDLMISKLVESGRYDQITA